MASLMVLSAMVSRLVGGGVVLCGAVWWAVSSNFFGLWATSLTRNFFMFPLFWVAGGNGNDGRLFGVPLVAVNGSNVLLNWGLKPTCGFCSLETVGAVSGCFAAFLVILLSSDIGP